MRALNAEIAIVGGGTTGRVAALLAADNGFDCALIERRPDPAAAQTPDDARILTLTLASQKILRAAGAWQCLAPPDVGRFERMHVWDENGAGRLDFDCRQLGRGTLGYTVSQGALTQALARAGRDRAQVCAGVEVAEIAPADNAIRLTLSDGRTLRAKLLIAADGGNSGIRRLAGIDYDVRAYQQAAVAGVVRSELSHERTARQRFLSDGPIAFLPMADQHYNGLVWSTTPEQAARLLSMDEDEFQEAAARAFDDRLGALVCRSGRQSFPLCRAQARRYCTERVALLGDAAHCVHPLAGLGANFGLLDAACLTQVITQARMKRRDYGALRTLGRYERWRKGENFVAMMTLEGLKYLFEIQTGPLPLIRNVGMGLFNASRLLKNTTMRLATGLEGDLPDVARNG